MKHLKYTIFLFLSLAYSKESNSQQVIIAGSDSCLIVNKNDTFLIKVVKADADLNNEFSNFKSFKDSCSIKLGIDTLKFIQEFKSLDINHKLDTIAAKMIGREAYSYTIKSINDINKDSAIQDKEIIDIKKDPINNFDNKYLLLLLIIPILIIIIIFRKKNVKKVNNKKSVNNKQNLKSYNIESNEQKIVILKKEKEELLSQIKSQDLAIKQHQLELSTKIKELNEKHEKQLKVDKEKLLTIIKENKQFDEIVSKIYDKYQFLNDERKYDNNFDLGKIIEAAYFLNSATKNYLLKLPVLFNMEFKSQGILSKSDKANIDYLMTNNIANNVLIADEDSVKRNQDLSKFITDLRKKLVEAKVKDVSNVIIENHRIKL
jgi:hypothetical protein